VCHIFGMIDSMLIVCRSCAILILVFWGTMSGNGLWVAALMVYAKLYSNSLLVSLNARGSIRTPAPSAAASSGGIVVTRTYNVDGTVSQTLRGEPVVRSCFFALTQRD
jgi:hypothetical protein